MSDLTYAERQQARNNLAKFHAECLMETIQRYLDGGNAAYLFYYLQGYVESAIESIEDVESYWLYVD